MTTAEYDHCAGCGKPIGTVGEYPGDRWRNAADDKDYCVDCYGTAHTPADPPTRHSRVGATNTNEVNP